jgi:DNA processing protein
MTDRELCIAINMISGIGYVKYMALRERFPSADDIRNANRSDLMQVEGIGQTLAERIVGFDWDAELSKELQTAERGGVTILTLQDESYPEMLRDLYDPPLVLYIRGRLPKYPERTVAIVGSRRISAYGEAMTEIITEEASTCGFTVISGLALGTDTVAHRTAVKMAGKTIGVLGGGLMHLHPKENLQLAREMVRGGGAVISEFPLDFPVARVNFPRRNRIVAALSRATLVIEAGADSGALITARQAIEIGREVFALPGRVDNPQAAGCHKLIKEGAALIESFEDVAVSWGLGLLPVFDDGADTGVEYDPASFSDLDPLSAKICTFLSESEANFDEIMAFCGCEAGQLLAVLMRLELKLLVEKGEDQYYRLTRKQK